MSQRRGGHKRRSSSAPKLNQPPVEVTFTSLGARGDGIGKDATGKTWYVPNALPGETALIKPLAKRGDGFAGDMLELTQSSEDRVAPPCPHFGVCGGCDLQHLAEAPYAAWKRTRVVEALSRQGLTPEVAPTLSIGPGSRRRASFSFLHTGKRVVIGFHQRAGKHIEPLTQCALLTPDLWSILDPLRDMMGPLFSDKASGDIIINQASNGPDVLIRCTTPLDLAMREQLSDFCEIHNVPRLAWQQGEGADPEPVIVRATPKVTMGDITVPLHPGAFLQPSLGGEKALTAAVLEGVDDARHVLDAFAGCGSFSLPLGRSAKVHALEGLEDARTTLQRAADLAGLAGRVTSKTQDLFRSPPIAEEFDLYDAVVFDPPRAGADEFSRHLAQSNVPKVVAVSCNPQTFARDMRLLVDGGYSLGTVQPVDQFTWSAHVEIVTSLTKTTP